MEAETPVLIAGGGPVGLTLAMELGLRGIPCVLLNDKPVTAQHPKANAVGARTMEHFRRLGVASRLRDAGLPQDHPTDLCYLTRLTGYKLARMPMPSSSEAMRLAREGKGSWPTPEPPHRVSQIFLEAILKEHTESFSNVSVRFGWRLESHRQENSRVVAEAVETATGRQATIRARYLVGCDGPRSIIRKSLGIEYEGESGVVRPFMGGSMLAVYFRAPGLRSRLVVDPAWMYWILNPDIRAFFVEIDGADRWLFHTQIPPGVDPSQLDSVSLICAAAGIAFPVEIISALPWTAGYSLVAQRYGSGRVYLAGDSIHLFTPTGGLGMNTGVDDAVNLGWKLAAVLQGWGGPNLLDSFEAERRPIGIRNVNFAKGFAVSVGTQSISENFEADTAEACEERRRVGERLFDHARREFIIPGIWLGLRYDDSPVCWTDGSPPPSDEPNDFIPMARPGARAPHLWLPDGSALFDRLGKYFTLLRLGPELSDQVEMETSELESAAAVRNVPMEVLDVPDPAGRDLYGARFVLIRPDHHVAWRGDRMPKDLMAVIDRIRGA